MNTQQRAAMQMALEALEKLLYGADQLRYGVDGGQEAITALREALAQPQGEWVDLTDDEIDEIESKILMAGGEHNDIYRAVIAKFKEKNAPVQREQQEPVAWMNAERNTITWDRLYPNMTPLYAAPQTPDVCGEVYERAKLCYGCGKNLDEANAEHERKYGELAGTHNWTPPSYTDEQWQKLDQEYQDHVAEQKPVGIVWDASASVVMDSAAPKNENQEVAELRKQVAALKAVVDAWNNVEQEPVAWHHPECKGECIACLIERCVKDSYGTQGLDFMLRHINAAPVSAEAIRAEALEDAVKFLEENGMIAPNGFTAAGIRGLK